MEVPRYIENVKAMMSNVDMMCPCIIYISYFPVTRKALFLTSVLEPWYEIGLDGLAK